MCQIIYKSHVALFCVLKLFSEVHSQPKDALIVVEKLLHAP